MGRDRLGPRAACNVEESEEADYKNVKGQRGASKYSLKDDLSTAKSCHIFFYCIHIEKPGFQIENNRE